MIVYQDTKTGFRNAVLSGEIENIILDHFVKKLHRRTSGREVESWRNSLLYMDRVLSDDEIPLNAGVTIECQIPQTSKRIDFIVSGEDELHQPHIIIIELKQWTTAELTSKDGVIKTLINKTLLETNHPSYQAWSYATLLNDFSETVYTENISIKPCAFLHNYKEDTVIRNLFYSEYLEKAPVFLKTDMRRLQDFIKGFVKYGDYGALMYRIDQGKIKPSKHLADSLVGLLKGNKEFILIDDQKLVFETVLSACRSSESEGKKVVIVEGGPGTGKSVVAINLLIETTNREYLAQYVTKNAAPRAVYESKLTRNLKRSRFNALFQGSGRYHDTPPNTFDLLIVDEAHRLNERSGMFQNIGENQVKEIIRASKSSVFFIDEDQRVTMKDIGTKREIIRWATSQHAEVIEMALSSQFRCNGSDGYLAWLDSVMQIRETANNSLEGINYDFRVLSNPSELRDLIFEKNKESNKARLVAGYCWDWISKNNTSKTDIHFPEYGFAMPWNFAQDSYLWAIKADSVKEVGCIHTCQGLELDYIGVIIGKDLIYQNGIVMVDPSKRSKMDSSIKGYKSRLKENPKDARESVRLIIKNTYRTLMTRGLKGCYIWCEDIALGEWVKSRMKTASD